MLLKIHPATANATTSQLSCLDGWTPSAQVWFCLTSSIYSACKEIDYLNHQIARDNHVWICQLFLWKVLNSRERHFQKISKAKKAVYYTTIVQPMLFQCSKRAMQKYMKNWAYSQGIKIKENTCNLQLKDLNKQLLLNAGILRAKLYKQNSTRFFSGQLKCIQI